MAPVKADVRSGSNPMRPSHRRPCSTALPRPHQHIGCVPHYWGLQTHQRSSCKGLVAAAHTPALHGAQWHGAAWTTAAAAGASSSSKLQLLIHEAQW